MHTSLQRLNAVLAYFVTVAFCVVALISATSPIFLATVNKKALKADVTVEDVVVKGARTNYYGSRTSAEVGHVKFSINADLTPLWHWNTKEVFVYLTVDYATSQQVNQLVLWDRIILSKGAARFNIRREKAKYAVTDMDRKLSGAQGNVTLHWNIVPWVGPMLTQTAETSAPIMFPKK
ncbi:signal peptidase 22kDa subunit [Gaertneriomyces semiglobifer]|nr:signal peptidase 22kDa subunit [Gaertneriomyces semiglobifer]